MNQSFRVIFQAATGTFVAVSELTKSNGKTKSSRALRHAAVAGVLALSAASSMATEVCEMPDGQSGTLNSSGLCVMETAAANSSLAKNLITPDMY